MSLALAGCGRSTEKENIAPEKKEIKEIKISCGTMVSPRNISDFVARIKKYKPGEENRDLYFDKVVITGKGRRKYKVVDSRYLSENIHLLPSAVDWDHMGKAIADGRLNSGGWRGCFLDTGKAFFVADRSGKISLQAFDWERSWE